MFFELLDGGHDPRAINYKELATDWIRQNILKKYELDCLEVEWLKKTIGFFCLNAKTIWKKHRGKVTGLNVQKQHAKFFDKYIDATNLSPCTCVKCFPLEPSEIMTHTPSNLSKYDSKVMIIKLHRIKFNDFF